MPATFADRAFKFYRNLDFSHKLPDGVGLINPYESSEASGYLRQFLDKFYSDNNERTLVLGINPGRFGSNMTGIAFTDAVALLDACGIQHSLPLKRELSSQFIYSFISECGGAELFYQRFFLGAVSPLGFIKNGKNYNYYDNNDLQTIVKPFIVESLRSHIAFGADTENVVVLGAGKNTHFLTELNKEYGFFKNIHALEHPRFIMQYKRRYQADYFAKFKRVFTELRG